MPLPIFVSHNGELIPPAEAHVSIFNPALSSSYGVLRVVPGPPRRTVRRKRTPPAPGALGGHDRPGAAGRPANLPRLDCRPARRQ